MWKSVLRYPVDKWAVLLAVSCFSAQLASYFWMPNVWMMAALSVVLIPFFLSLTAYNHNHAHTMTFNSPVLNRLFEMVLFFQTGSSPFSIALNHIVGHHASFGDPELDTLNWHRADGSVMTRHEFAFKCMADHYPSCFRLGRGRTSLMRKFLAFLLLCVALLAALVYYHPVAACAVFIIPMLIQQYILKWGAHPHHSGLELVDDYTCTRTHSGRFYNWATWNAGYHAAHHFQQALHWTLLPAYHDNIADKIPPQLQGDGWGRKAAQATPAAS